MMECIALLISIFGIINTSGCPLKKKVDNMSQMYRSRTKLITNVPSGSIAQPDPVIQGLIKEFVSYSTLIKNGKQQIGISDCGSLKIFLLNHSLNDFKIRNSAFLSDPISKLHDIVAELIPSIFLSRLRVIDSFDTN
jgi:hypothetical protein